MAIRSEIQKSPLRLSPRRLFGYALAVAVVALAAFLLYRTLSQYDWQELVTAVTAVSTGRIVLALGFAAASYLCLTAVDWLGLRYAGAPLSYPRAALTSFVSLSLGHNIGFGSLSSGAVRYRFYSRWGLGVGEVAKVTLYSAMTVALGLSILGGLAFIIVPDTAVEVMKLPAGVVRGIGVACLAWPAAYLLLAAVFGGRALSFRGRRLEVPRLTLAFGQAVVGTANFSFVAAALHQAVLSIADLSYLKVASAYVSANVATIVSHVPGGLGVVESVLLFLLPGANLIGAVLVFRFVYFLVPLAFGGLLFAVTEVLLRSSRNR